MAPATKKRQKATVRVCIHFIPRESVEVNPQSLHINLPMRRQRHPIHTQLRITYRMHHLCNLLHIVDRPQHVARMCACHQRGLFRQQRFQIFSREDWRDRRVSRRGGGGWPPLNFVAVQLGEAYPGGDVGFVIEGGDDDFGADGEIEDKGEIREELGC